MAQLSDYSKTIDMDSAGPIAEHMIHQVSRRFLFIHNVIDSVVTLV